MSDGPYARVRSAAVATGDRHSTRQAKGTQRQRLLDGMIAVSNRGGYASANVSAVIGEAGVSRPTFYDFFSDRDDCFSAAIEHAHGRLQGATEEALAAFPAPEAAAAAVSALVAFASSEPSLARFLMSEAMGGGPRALDARDQGIARIAARIEEAGGQVRGAGAQSPDVESQVLLGCVCRVLARRLRRGEPTIANMREDLLAWLAAYRRPTSEHRWRQLSPVPARARRTHSQETFGQETGRALPQGRQRLTREQIAENHRLRILYATALMAARKGYTATTVADIAKLARLDKHVFYRQFSDKQDAFMAAHEIGFQRVMEVSSAAFFAGRDWPGRSWAAGRALAQLLEQDPLIAHVGFVESHAVGPGAVQRIEDSQVAFMFFLQEGLLHGNGQTLLSRVGMEAIVAGVFEVVYRQARAGGRPEQATMLPHIAHLWLTPFLGPVEADAFVDARLRSERRRSAPAPGGAGRDRATRSQRLRTG